MVREDDGGALGNFEVLRRDRDARVLQCFNFAAQTLQIDHDAVAQHIHNTWQADTRGNEMEGKFTVFVHDGMSCVIAALIPADDVIISCNEVNHTALAFVAPVDAYDRAVAHNSKLLIRFFTTVSVLSFHSWPIICDFSRFVNVCFIMFIISGNYMLN